MYTKTDMLTFSVIYQITSCASLRAQMTVLMHLLPHEAFAKLNLINM